MVPKKTIPPWFVVLCPDVSKSLHWWCCISKCFAHSITIKTAWSASKTSAALWWCHCLRKNRTLILICYASFCVAIRDTPCSIVMGTCTEPGVHPWQSFDVGSRTLYGGSRRFRKRVRFLLFPWVFPFTCASWVIGVGLHSFVFLSCVEWNYGTHPGTIWWRWSII